MKPDIFVGWDKHIQNGNVWAVDLELPMQDVPGGDINYYTVEVLVVANSPDMAQFIASQLYPDYESISVQDYPIRPGFSD